LDKQTIDFFSEESVDLHNTPEQLQRQEKLNDIDIVSFDKKYQCGMVKSQENINLIYNVSLHNCNCIDFVQRNLPCKHIYKLASALNLYSSNRSNRSTTLIADFSSGYAKNWKFAVRPSCYSSLDIISMSRATNKKDNTGKAFKENVLTQGCSYNFSEGQVFYNDKIAYETIWGNALQKLKYSLQIQTVSPSLNNNIVTFKDGQIVNQSAIRYGVIKFKMYHPSKDKTQEELLNCFECTQDKFVEFLKTGILYTTDNKNFSFDL